ncbi:MAG: ROK family protein [Ignavibacteriaceae bacterium]|nr:ROK family protein [Ignavibacteriaceae bacterium]
MITQSSYAVGVDLGGTNIKLGIVSEKGKIIKKTVVPAKAEDGPDMVIKQIIYGINILFNKNKAELAGIGIGAPGIVSNKKGTVEYPPNLPGWKKINLGSIIKKEFNTKVLVENDANAAAIGEMIFGAGKNIGSFVMITLGTGVGGAIVFNRKLFRGEHGGAGEVGHTTINYKGEKCNCGSYGCIETYAGNSYLIRRVKKDLNKFPGSLIWDLIDKNPRNLSPKIIHAAALKGDRLAASVIHNLGFHLGSALSSVSNLLNISTFIIGGGVAGFGSPLFKTIKETMTQRVLTPLRPEIKVIPAKLRNDAGIKGASSLIFYNS